MRVILFDIDGTLLLTGGAGLHALARAFRDLHGIDGAAEGVEFHGRTDPLILESIARKRLGRALEESELAVLLERYLGHLGDTLRSQPYRVLPGVPEILDGLRERGDVTLGLATGNVEPAAWAKLRRGGLDGYFDFGGFGSDSADRTELTRLAVVRGRDRAGPDAPVTLVGDTVHDVRCAIAVGVPCLAVATGNASEAALVEAGARWAVPTLDDPRVPGILGLTGAPPPRVDPARTRC